MMFFGGIKNKTIERNLDCRRAISKGVRDVFVVCPKKNHRFGAEVFIV
jgi:hypothetical protein